MILIVVSLLAIAGILTSAGLLYFQSAILLSKEHRLYRLLLHSFIFSIVFWIVAISLADEIHYSYSPEKYYILISIIANQILMIPALGKLWIRRNKYFKEDTQTRRYNVTTLVFYLIALAIYLYFSYAIGIQTSWEGISK